MHKTILMLVLGTMLVTAMARADGLKVENVSVAPRDGKTALVTFDVAWSNAYRFGRFHDAAWIFFKVRTDEKSGWQPLRLLADRVVNPAGYSSGEGTPLEFVVPSGADGFVGMFVRLAKDGRGEVAARKVTAVVDLNTEHRTLNTSLRAFGIEMAYVGEGPFFLGSGGTELNSFYAYTDDGEGAPTPPYRVTSAGPIPTGRQKGKLWARGIAPVDMGEIPAAFPNGYAGFYTMKMPYFTQAMVAGFLNTLTAAQAKGRWYPNYQGVAIKRVGEASNHVYTASAPEESCPWLSWTDGALVAAWAGLRPMTELEFEKAVRGADYPSPNDIGLSYWGLSDINGSDTYERLVSFCKPAGVTFAGSHGRGLPELPADWPKDYNATVFKGAYGKGFAYYSRKHQLTAGRMNELVVGGDRHDQPFAGWRAVRSGPQGDALTANVPVRFDASLVRPLARLGGVLQASQVSTGCGKPLAILDTAEDMSPVNSRCIIKSQPHALWQGPADASAKVFLGWDGEAVCVGVEATDDCHLNTQTGDSIWNGDAIQLGLITPKGTHWNLALALTTNGVALHQFAGESDALLKTADGSVTRDETAKTTRYGLRLPLAALGLKAGDTFGFNVMVCDGDDEKGMRCGPTLAPGLSWPFRPELYPRFVLAEK